MPGMATPLPSPDAALPLLFPAAGLPAPAFAPPLLAPSRRCWDTGMRKWMPWTLFRSTDSLTLGQTIGTVVGNTHGVSNGWTTSHNKSAEGDALHVHKQKE